MYTDQGGERDSKKSQIWPTVNFIAAVVDEILVSQYHFKLHVMNIIWFVKNIALNKKTEDKRIVKNCSDRPSEAKHLYNKKKLSNITRKGFWIFHEIKMMIVWSANVGLSAK